MFGFFMDCPRNSKHYQLTSFNFKWTARRNTAFIWIHTL